MSWQNILLSSSLLCIVLLVNSEILENHRQRSSRSAQLIVTSDYMMQIQCRAKCLTEMNSHECDYERCLRDLHFARKLGNCPRRSRDNETINMLESNCIDACQNWDYNCPMAERCCPNSCGSSCQRPTDLDRIKALPPIPSILSVMELRRKIEICWDVYSDIQVRSDFISILSTKVQCNMCNNLQ